MYRIWFSPQYQMSIKRTDAYLVDKAGILQVSPGFLGGAKRWPMEIIQHLLCT